MYQNMPHQGEMNHGARRHPHGRVLSAIQECEAVCEHLTHHLVMMGMVTESRTTQLLLLRDCADICGLTAKYIARMSQFAKVTADLCAHICEVCANECLRFNDPESQHCAQVCLHCARECRAFAGM